MENKIEIKYGDMFALGCHRIINGDAKDSEIIKKLIGKDKIKVLLVDPPYGIQVSQARNSFVKTKTQHRDIINDQFQSDEEYAKFTKDWLDAVKPHLEKKNSAYIFNSDKMIFALREGFLEAGFKFSQLIVWVKSHAVIGRLNYLPAHELVLYGWLGTHEFKKSPDKSVLFYPRPSKSNLHPTQKPIPLLRNLILNSSSVGDVIFDSFLGSGSTILAAEQTKRISMGVELDPEYCRVIIERFEKTFGIKAVKIEEVQ
ncbi:MAG: site-specific DNA-methyltransferase [Candidatus Berkelbacteria bacterium]|nr:site-specific DNA-methyltransferase [Candidatus Berkelbacteria bacterium]